MLNTWKPRLLCAALVGTLAVFGCLDFGTAQQQCLEDKHCKQPPPEPCNVTDPNDQPDDDFQDTNCDGIDGIADAGVFVDPLGGSDTGLGTASDPLKTLGKALEKVRTGTVAPIVYLAQGPYHEPGLIIDTPVSLYGSYARHDSRWDRDAGFITSLEGDTVGLIIRGISVDAGVVIERLTVASVNATEAGKPSIALKIIDSHGLRLRHNTLVAGQGAPGTDGGPGVPGMDGGAGQAGAPSDGNTASPTPAAGGISSCASMDQSGGAGRAGATNGAPGVNGSTGRPDGGPGGPGGDGGIPVVYDQETGNKRCRAQAGGTGASGIEGDPGSSGPRGEGMGMLSGETWIATQQGGNGTPGTAGSGGGGGGSGGSCPFEDPVLGAAGGGSGGGGGGGCGGEGGRGGGGGGASISVLLIRSNVQWEGTTTLRTGGGGRGGSGGEGGPGGAGGPGGTSGDGGVIESNIRYLSYGGGGGAGGPGGAGGRGGPGGGGGGGPSVGVWCWDAGYVDMGTFDPQLGNGGPGGSTGAGGNPGQLGTKVSFQSCTP
jgi:hypothetical protein